MPAAPSTNAPAAYCGHCGDPLDARDHGACRRRLELEPPRYCAACRRRMVVQVTPAAWSARCVEHGERSADTGADTGADTDSDTVAGTRT